MAAGVVEYLEKPFSLKSIKTIVTKHWQGESRGIRKRRNSMEPKNVLFIMAVGALFAILSGIVLTPAMLMVTP